MRSMESGVPAETSTEDRILCIFRDALNVEVPSRDTDLFEAGALDSLAFVELLVHLEREFGRPIPIEDLDISDFRSIRRIVAFLGGVGDSA
jgi:acyl carrier protein